jgi:Leucine-rich repeat (LRR) protein
MLLIVIIVAALFATIVEGYYECQPGTVVLDLTNTYLGTFPNVSTCATTLQKLYLSGTGLSVIPPEIGELGSLLELRVEGNQLTALPQEVGFLSNLRDMWASGNSISELPSTFSDLMLLRTLRLSRNSFPVVPPAIFNLNLQELFMDSNPLTTVPPELGNMHNLVGATFSYNPISSLPAELGGWWSLEWLYLWGTPVKCLPRSVTKLPNFVIGNYYPTCTNDTIAGYVVQRVCNKNTCSGPGKTNAFPGYCSRLTFSFSDCSAQRKRHGVRLPELRALHLRGVGRRGGGDEALPLGPGPSRSELRSQRDGGARAGYHSRALL